MSCRSRGFTMIELVVTLIVIGILAVVILPRFANRLSFETAGFADEALAAVQYARKVAVAARRNVCVTVSSSSITLTMAILAGSSQPCSGTAYVINPAGGNFIISPKHSDVTLSGSGITFDGQGRPSAATNITIIGDTNLTLSVVAGTGYAYIH